MKCFSSLEIALDDSLFYSFRSSSGLCDTIVPKELQENIESSFHYYRGVESSPKIQFLSQKFIEKLKPINFEVELVTLFSEINNYFSSVQILNNEPIQLLSQFDQAIILKNKGSDKVILTNNMEVVPLDISYLSENLSFDNSIIGFLNFIDLSDNMIKKYLTNYKRLKTYFGFDIEYLYNDYSIHNYLTYFKLLLRVSFINSVSIFKLFGKKIPIYLFDGNKLLIKVEPVLNTTFSHCYVFYSLIQDEIKIQDPKLYELSCEQFSWYKIWRFRLNHSYNLLESQRNFTTDPKNQRVMAEVDNEIDKSQYFNMGSAVNNQTYYEFGVQNKGFNNKIHIFSPYHQEGKSHFDKTIPFSETEKKCGNSLNSYTDDKTLELFLKSFNKQKRRKNDNSGENSDFGGSEDYVDKLIQQQTMQLFNH